MTRPLLPLACPGWNQGSSARITYPHPPHSAVRRLRPDRNLISVAVLLGSLQMEAAAAVISPVVPADATTLSERIDQAIGKRLEAEKIRPSPLADDAEFLRRVYLDITGVIPPANKAAAFLDSKDPNKRAKLIDELLSSPRYGRHMADVWVRYLLPRTSDNR